MEASELVRLEPLMERTEGRRDVTVGVIDGPVQLEHPAFSGQSIRQIDRDLPASCHSLDRAGCLHGTLVMGLLAANRNMNGSGLCPGCGFVVRPIFPDAAADNETMPASNIRELKAAIADSIEAGANVINVSAALLEPWPQRVEQLNEILDHAARVGVLVVAAAGNQGTVGASALTRHPWVIPVASCDLQGRPSKESNLGKSIGRHGLSAPGEGIPCIQLNGRTMTFSGTSAATPFVTGAIALLWSLFRGATAAQIKLAVTGTARHRRTAITPPLLDAWGAYLAMSHQ
jgi:subtilisin family serine protease